jgi:hypothetical protein
MNRIIHVDHRKVEVSITQAADRSKAIVRPIRDAGVSTKGMSGSFIRRDWNRLGWSLRSWVELQNRLTIE